MDGYADLLEIRVAAADLGPALNFPVRGDQCRDRSTGGNHNDRARPEASKGGVRDGIGKSCRASNNPFKGCLIVDVVPTARRNVADTIPRGLDISPFGQVAGLKQYPADTRDGDPACSRKSEIDRNAVNRRHKIRRGGLAE